MAQLADQDQVVRHLNKTLSRVATYGTEFFPVQVRFFFLGAPWSCMPL